MLPNFESLSGRCRGVEQVVHLLVVDLHVADLDLRLPGALIALLRHLLGYPLEERVAEPRDDPLVVLGAHHAVGLAGAGLAVGEYAGVVPVEGVVEQVDAEGLEDALLAGEVGVVVGQERVEAVIEGEALRGLPTGKGVSWEKQKYLGTINLSTPI